MVPSRFGYPVRLARLAVAIGGTVIGASLLLPWVTRASIIDLTWGVPGRILPGASVTLACGAVIVALALMGRRPRLVLVGLAGIPALIGIFHVLFVNAENREDLRMGIPLEMTFHPLRPAIGIYLLFVGVVITLVGALYPGVGVEEGTSEGV